jgi:hypothetical protein
LCVVRGPLGSNAKVGIAMGILGFLRKTVPRADAAAAPSPPRMKPW